MQITKVERNALDNSAPSTIAEYVRYLDLDILGKILARSFLVNRLGYVPDQIYTPLGRYGDAKTKYRRQKVAHDLTDGYVNTGQGKVRFEVKCARVNIANRFHGGTAENWAFHGLLTSPGKAKKAFDILIAIGVHALGLEDEGYWTHLEKKHSALQTKGIPCELQAWPHDPSFLSMCSFFIIPRTSIANNYFRVMLTRVPRCRYADYHAPGYDKDRCREVWQNALDSLAESSLQT